MSSGAIKSVLYAEDDENDVFFMERAFSKLKQQNTLHVVSSGRAAVDYLAGRNGFVDRARYPLPDLVLLDVKMPELSGLEVLRWARAQAQFQALPILMFTSSTQRADIDFSRVHRASGYLVKPSNAQDLTALVRKILDACAQPPPVGGVLLVDGNQMVAD